MEYRLDVVEGLEQSTGKLVVKGPNVMLGYLKADAPGVLQPPEGGWYDTGDIVAVDTEGFVTIQGRLKRFAKIAGEMVSLTAVEAAIQKLWPEKTHAVISVPDEKKGEKLILFTTQPEPKSEELLQHFRKSGFKRARRPKTNRNGRRNSGARHRQDGLSKPEEARRRIVWSIHRLEQSPLK